jgi:hypothetical protein
MKDVGMSFVSHVCCFFQSHIPQKTGTLDVYVVHSITHKILACTIR